MHAYIYVVYEYTYIYIKKKHVDGRRNFLSRLLTMAWIFFLRPTIEMTMKPDSSHSQPSNHF